MNLSIKNNYTILNDLCDQIFDYFNLTIYDLENKLDDQLSIENFKNKLDTFADKHFKSALFDFDNEIQNLKSHFPNELFQIAPNLLQIHQYTFAQWLFLFLL